MRLDSEFARAMREAAEEIHQACGSDLESLLEDYGHDPFSKFACVMDYSLLETYEPDALHLFNASVKEHGRDAVWSFLKEQLS